MASATTYDVELATDPGFASIVASASGLTTTSFEASDLNRDTTYYWRVRANNPCGNGVFSAAFSFTTERGYCSSVVVGIPDNFASGVDSLITIGDAGTIADLDLAITLDLARELLGQRGANVRGERPQAALARILSRADRSDGRSSSRPRAMGSCFRCRRSRPR